MGAFMDDASAGIVSPACTPGNSLVVAHGTPSRRFAAERDRARGAGAPSRPARPARLAIAYGNRTYQAISREMTCS